MMKKLKKINAEINEAYTSLQSYRVVLMGNPNVGKSSVFNVLSGMHQHTGNWSGKTVQVAHGTYHEQDKVFEVIDLPGTYALLPHSYEEEVACTFLMEEAYDVCVIVCDATSLRRNIAFILQVMEVTPNVVIALNLMDEAKKKAISIDIATLKEWLQVEVIAISARKKEGIAELKQAINTSIQHPNTCYPVVYPTWLEEILQEDSYFPDTKIRWLRKQQLPQISQAVQAFHTVTKARCERKDVAIQEYMQTICDEHAQRIYQSCVKSEDMLIYHKDHQLDRILTHKVWGVFVMLMMLAIIFWITIAGANIPSSMLSELFASWHISIQHWLESMHMHPILRSILMDGIYTTLTWIISVMLPPMAIFFPMFTLLEDFGYLPRVAFHLDHMFHKAKACGKQALTMSMGFGCNAVGVSGCRIIDSYRERLLAILTNNFVPCNGRFPLLITISSLFFAGFLPAEWASITSALVLTLIILFGVFLTFLTSYGLSKTVLKGTPSSFTLELPPYRKPQVIPVIIRSIFDRTLLVLGRAIAVAIPAGVVIWVFANVEWQEVSILTHIAQFLDPFATQIGMDGYILLAFILGFPANEIVLPILLMGYLASNQMVEITSMQELKTVLIMHGWTIKTAICTMLFSLIHFPCATTMLTIYKETGSRKWTLLAFLLPTLIGIFVCFLVSHALFWIG